MHNKFNACVVWTSFLCIRIKSIFNWDDCIWHIGETVSRVSKTNPKLIYLLFIVEKSPGICFVDIRYHKVSCSFDHNSRLVRDGMKWSQQKHLHEWQNGNAKIAKWMDGERGLFGWKKQRLYQSKLNKITSADEKLSTPQYQPTLIFEHRIKLNKILAWKEQRFDWSKWKEKKSSSNNNKKLNHFLCQ